MRIFVPSVLSCFRKLEGMVISEALMVISLSLVTSAGQLFPCRETQQQYLHETCTEVSWVDIILK